eukprot:GSMAST32.ASY1.ANO1.1412.1 assembled CDS
MQRSLVKLVRLPASMPIMQQLLIEEALLRGDNANWCILSECSGPPTIVMGVAGKPDDLLNVELVRKEKIPTIRRFSGGGTVVVDVGTLFASFIFRSDCIPIGECNPKSPKSIMDWTRRFYTGVFHRLVMIFLQCILTYLNMYVLFFFQFRFFFSKFGGNAQSITKDRWLHHSSLLWDFNDKNMEYLCIPPEIKRPKYRKDRGHLDFLCKLGDVLPQFSSKVSNPSMLSPVSPDDVFIAIKDELSTIFDVSTCKEDDLREIKRLQRFGDYRRSTKYIDV